jgi:hypothetical protein
MPVKWHSSSFRLAAVVRIAVRALNTCTQPAPGITPSLLTFRSRMLERVAAYDRRAYPRLRFPYRVCSVAGTKIAHRRARCLSQLEVERLNFLARRVVDVIDVRVDVSPPQTVKPLSTFMVRALRFWQKCVQAVDPFCGAERSALRRVFTGERQDLLLRAGALGRAGGSPCAAGRHPGQGGTSRARRRGRAGVRVSMSMK